MPSPDTPDIPGAPLLSATTMLGSQSAHDAAHTATNNPSGPHTAPPNNNTATQEAEIPRFQFLVDPSFSHNSEYGNEELVIARLEDRATEVNVCLFI